MTEITHKRHCHEMWRIEKRDRDKCLRSVTLLMWFLPTFFISQTAHVHLSQSLLSSSRYKYKHFLTLLLSHIKDTSSLSATAQSLASLCSFVLWKWLLGFRLCLHCSCSSLALPQLLLTWKVMLAKY
jgi:hypothetical protein